MIVYFPFYFILFYSLLFIRPYAQEHFSLIPFAPVYLMPNLNCVDGQNVKECGFLDAFKLQFKTPHSTQLRFNLFKWISPKKKLWKTTTTNA